MKFGSVIFRRFRRNRLALAGLVTIFIIALAVVAAPFISPYNPASIDIAHLMAPPSAKHLMGTDELGRDVLSRMMYGGRISLSVGFVAEGISLIIGILLGAMAGYYGGKLDAVLMRFVDVMLTFPVFFLILAVIAITEGGVFTIMVIIGATGWMGVARLVRAEFLTLKERDFVVAARASGAGHLRIIFRHILPNALSPVFVSATFGVAGAILVESGLSFLGLGVHPPHASWGSILAAGRENIEIAWWLSLYPGLAILITVLSYNLVGEGLRDALDPRLWESED